MNDWEFFLPHFRDAVNITARTVVDGLTLMPEALRSAPREIVEAVGKAKSERKVLEAVDAVLASHVLPIAGSFGAYGYHLIQVAPGVYSVRDFYPARRKIEETQKEIKQEGFVIERLRKDLEKVTETLYFLLDNRVVLIQSASNRWEARNDTGMSVAGETRQDAIDSAIKLYSSVERDG